MENRNEFWQSQPDLLTKTIQTANKRTELAEAEPVIIWHYTIHQPPITDKEKRALDRKNKNIRYPSTLILILFVAVLLFYNIAIYNLWKFNIEGILISFALTLITLPIILVVVVPIFYVIQSQSDVASDGFDKNKNATYLLTNKAFYIYLPNKYDKSLDFGEKIAISDISAIKTNPASVEIYTNTSKPRIFNMPATEAETLKQHLLQFSTDILDADK
jgi:membrane protein YdbS with pleckstrin-like domain